MRLVQSKYVTNAPAGYCAIVRLDDVRRWRLLSSARRNRSGEILARFQFLGVICLGSAHVARLKGYKKASSLIEFHGISFSRDSFCPVKIGEN